MLQRGFLYTQMMSWVGRSPSCLPKALHLYDRIRADLKAQTMTLDLIGYNTMISALGEALKQGSLSCEAASLDTRWGHG